MTDTLETPAQAGRWTAQWKELYAEVITTGLCTGCAGCVVTCPHDVIGYEHVEGKYKPFHLEDELGLDNCVHGEKGCTSCTRACPRFRDWEVEVDEFAVLLDRPGRTVVHECGERGDPLGRLPLAQRPEVAGVQPVGPRTVAEHRDRFGDLPPRHRPQASVGGQEVDEVGRPGTGETHDDDRWLELDLERLGVAPGEVLEPQSRPQEPEQAFADRKSTRLNSSHSQQSRMPSSA